MANEQAATGTAQVQPRDGLLSAMHLEVFAPKPTSREKERRLTEWLDSLLEEGTLPINRDRSDEDLAVLNSYHRNLVATSVDWESTIYGYSVYETDGYFMGLTNGERKAERCIRELTLVLKFIVTNYCSPFRNDRGHGRLVDHGSSITAAHQDSEWHCMNFHYEDTCDYIERRISDFVLDDQVEVWSQRWYAALRRRARKRPPVVADKTAKKDRFGTRPVLCVFDYMTQTDGS